MNRITDQIMQRERGPADKGLGQQIKELESAIIIAESDPALTNHSQKQAARIAASAAQIKVNALRSRRDSLIALLPHSARKGLSRGRVAL